MEETETIFSRGENLSARARDWMVTIWADPDWEMEIPVGASYMCYGHEIAPITERPHVHLFVQFEQKKRFGAVKALFPNDSHIEQRRGTPDEAKVYCLKENWFTREQGEIRQSMQGHRSDLEQAIEMLSTGRTLHEVFEEMPACASRNVKVLYTYLTSTFSPEFVPNMKVMAFYGRTGTWKTRTAISIGMPSVFRLIIPSYMINGQKLFFDGYTGQDYMIIDEFRGQLDLSYALGLFDKYRMLIDVKGTMTVSGWKALIVISDRHPIDWYHGLLPEHYEQLIRRFDTIVKFEEMGMIIEKGEL